MSQVYRAVSSTPGAVVFGNIANSNISLSFAQTRTSIGDKTNRVPLLRNSVVLRTPEKVNLTPDCPGTCSTTLATRVVEVRTSAPMASKAAIIADLEEIIRVINIADTDQGFFDGFLPSQLATFSQP
jgi:hypothetical protein